MGSEKVYEMKETVLDDVTPMLGESGETDGDRRSAHVTIRDDKVRAAEESGCLPGSGRHDRFIDWSRRRSSAMSDGELLSVSIFNFDFQFHSALDKIHDRY